ncbi:MAG: hypothetical protein Aurels2KO_07410 [Aureliella sp.]
MRNRKLVIGVDEAGYGPNLGPLTLAASIWEVDANLSEAKFCEAMSGRFGTTSLSASTKSSDGAGGKVPLGDSKKLYDRSKGIAPLETGVLAMTQLLGDFAATSGLTDTLGFPCTLGQLAKAVDLETLAPHDDASLLPPWYDAAHGLPVPKSDLPPDAIDGKHKIADSELQKHDINLVGMAATAVTEPEFNRRLVITGSKGLVLSQATLQLVCRAIGKTELPVECFCDRQGGRKNYMPILLDAMPDAWFTETAQETARSSYSCQSPKLDIHFSVGGDSFPPTALASMLAKYLRERFMEAFNAYWVNLLPDLKPTAGYPVDAKRFAEQISGIANEQELSPALWWRDK